MRTDATGERFIPEAMGGQLIEAEHVVRYGLAARLAGGRRVLDAGCGVGWGTGVLVAAGASSATGLDLDADAVANARQRVPDADFVQGDLARLPWDAASFDLVVCFETLEHVAEQERALDELVRVLAPDGLLLVSSPNPRVYPAGNPFHRHELTPEELEAAVARRLANVTQWNQHTQIASVLVRKGSLPPGETREVLAQAVAPLESGSDPYSLVIAGRGPLPSLPPVVGCAPCDQLLHLEALSAGLSEERERMSEDQQRVVAEREQILAERSKLLLDIAEQGALLSEERERMSEDQQRVVAEREQILAERSKLLLDIAEQGALLSEERERMSEDQQRVVAEREQILAERSKLLLEIREQQTTISALAEQIGALERRNEALRREREHTAVLLLESEQQLAEVLASAAARLREQEQIAAGLAEQVADLQDEVVVFRTSRSWRFTAPLRNAKRRLAPKP